MNKLGLLGLGSRLSRISEMLMREVQQLYLSNDIDFDPYLFPVFKSVLDGKTNTTEVTDYLGITQPGVTQFVNKLVEKGLIQQKTDEKDKRKKVLSVTPSGQKLVLRIKPIWIALDYHLNTFTQEANTLSDHLETLADQIQSGKFREDVQKMINSYQTPVEIIDYDNKYVSNFRDLNLEWLKTFFVVEPYDNEVLSNPDKYILDKNGWIFFAKQGDNILGTVAIMLTNEGYELTKMAVSPQYRGLKIGHKLLERCIDFSKSNGYGELLLYSNSKLKPAIHLYEKFGFEHIPVPKNSPYLRSDVKMVLKLK